MSFLKDGEIDSDYLHEFLADLNNMTVEQITIRTLRNRLYFWIDVIFNVPKINPQISILSRLESIKLSIFNEITSMKVDHHSEVEIIKQVISNIGIGEFSKPNGLLENIQESKVIINQQLAVLYKKVGLSHQQGETS